jgi:hypothetical protein
MHYFEESNTLSLHLPSSHASSAPTHSSSRSSLTIIIHPPDFRGEKKVREMNMECDGQMEIDKLIKKITHEKVELFKRDNRKLEMIEKSLKAKDLDGKIIELFEIRKKNKRYLNLKFKVFKATEKSDQRWT